MKIEDGNGREIELIPERDIDGNIDVTICDDSGADLTDAEIEELISFHKDQLQEELDEIEGEQKC